MTAIILGIVGLIALWAAYAAGREKGRAEGMVAGLLIAEAQVDADEPLDPISEFVEARRIASEGGLQ